MSVSYQSHLLKQKTHVGQTHDFENVNDGGATRIVLGLLSVVFLMACVLFFLVTINYLFDQLSYGSYRQMFQFFKAI